MSESITANAMFRNVMTYKPHAELRARLADPEQSEATFTELLEFHRQYHPEVEDYDEQMRNACLDTLDGMITHLNGKMRKLNSQLGELAAKADQLSNIRNNLMIEGE